MEGAARGRFWACTRRGGRTPQPDLPLQLCQLSGPSWRGMSPCRQPRPAAAFAAQPTHSSPAQFAVLSPPAALPDVRVGTPVSAVASEGPQGPVKVTASDGEALYDAVILATHSDISLRLVEGWAPQVRRLQGASCSVPLPAAGGVHGPAGSRKNRAAGAS